MVMTSVLLVWLANPLAATVSLHFFIVFIDLVNCDSFSPQPFERGRRPNPLCRWRHAIRQANAKLWR